MEAKKEGKTGARNRSRPDRRKEQVPARHPESWRGTTRRDRRKEQVPARHPEPCTPPLTAPIAFTWRLCEAHSFLCGAVGNLRAVAVFSLTYTSLQAPRCTSAAQHDAQGGRSGGQNAECGDRSRPKLCATVRERGAWTRGPRRCKDSARRARRPNHYRHHGC